MRDRKIGVWALMDYEIPSDEARRERNSRARPRAHEKTKVVARKGRRIGPFSPVAQRFAIFQLFLKLPLPRPPKIIARPSRMTATGTSGALVM